MKKTIALIMLVVLAVGSIAAQDRKSAPRRDRTDRSRYERSRYGDVADLRIREAGTLEQELGPEKEKQVRLLIVSGNLNDRDLRYIKKLCDRSRVYGSDGKEVDNYIDIDMAQARINNGGGFFTSFNRDVLTNSMFANCSHLRSIVLPDRVRTIDRGAFRNCTNLEDVVLPAGLDVLGDDAFANCYQLMNIYLPDGMRTVGHRAFQGCSRLRKLYIPESVSSIGDYAFESTQLYDVYLPDRLDYLGEGAFAKTELRSIYIPRYTKIGNNNLGYMSKCQEFIVDRDNRNYTVVEGGLYNYDVTKLLRYPAKRPGVLYVPDGVKVICNNACNNCSGITGVELPATLEYIGSSAFANCRGLRSINLPASCTNIYSYAFYNSGITSIELPVGVSRICESTFQDCNQLVKIEIPYTVSAIDPNAFHDCESLQRVVIPDNVTTLGKSVFEGCKSLAFVNLGNGLQSIGEYTFKKCKSLTTITMPSTLKSIGKNAFRECALNCLNLNEGLQTLGDNAFSDNQLVEFIIPSTVTHIGKKVAEKNKQLGRIVSMSSTPAQLDKVSNNKVILIVPAAAVDAYSNAKNWKNFKNIQGQ